MTSPILIGTQTGSEKYSVVWTVGYSQFVSHFNTVAEGQAFFATMVADRAENVRRIGFASWDK